MTASPIDAFMDAMRRLELRPRVDADLVVYNVEPVDGAHAGSAIETGVALAELARWPQVPPHWIHFPAGVGFKRTNSRASQRNGWLMHSRKVTAWGRDPDLGVTWASHVRGVLSEATS